MAYINTHVVQPTKDNGKIINNMGQVYINLLMELFIKDNGKNIKCMELAGLLQLMEGSGKESIGRVNFKQEGRNS